MSPVKDEAARQKVTASLSAALRRPSGSEGLVGVDREQAIELANAAHEMCPCSRAIRVNVPVELSVARELTKKGTHAMRALPPVLLSPLSYVKKGVSDDYSAHF